MNPNDRLVDTERGIVSREIFVNDGLFAEEQEKLFARDGDRWLLARREILLDQSVLLAKNLTVFF